MSNMATWPRHNYWMNPESFKETPLLDLDWDEVDTKFIHNLRGSRYLVEEECDD